MASQLESLPLDVLHRCAIFCGSTSTYDPPTATARLRQTSSTLRDALDMEFSPNVYGQIFPCKFDKAALCRRCASTNIDSALAVDLRSRYQLLRRSKSMDLSENGLMKDLWTALWLFLESDGLNERQLQAANFSSFILEVARTRLDARQTSSEPELNCFSFEALVVWLLCFALSRRSILALGTRNQDQVYGLIFPYILLSNKVASTAPPCPGRSRTRNGCICPEPVTQDGDKASTHQTATSTPLANAYRKRPRTLPDPSFAAINVALTIVEARPMGVPQHLPENRAVANVAHLVGPTQEDYRAWVSYKTPLFADSIPQECVDDAALSSDNRSMLHELEFRDLLQSIPLDSTHPDIRYIPGPLTGVWEGTLRTLPLSPASPPSSNPSTTFFQKPIQCALIEFTNVSDGLSPLKHTEILDQLYTSEYSLNNDGSELSVRGCKYRKHGSLDSEGNHPDGTNGIPFHNVMLHGQTLEVHDTAWGGFRFWGGVYEDGRVVLKRLAKDNGGDQGVWIFEGRLRFGTAFLGRWRVSGEPTNVGVDHGVFSMGNSTANWKEW